MESSCLYVHSELNFPFHKKQCRERQTNQREERNYITIPQSFLNHDITGLSFNNLFIYLSFIYLFRLLLFIYFWFVNLLGLYIYAVCVTVYQPV